MIQKKNIYFILLFLCMLGKWQAQWYGENLGYAAVSEETEEEISLSENDEDYCILHLLPSSPGSDLSKVRLAICHNHYWPKVPISKLYLEEIQTPPEASL